jgi:acyl carrier protein
MNRHEGAACLIKVMRHIFDADDLQYDDALALGDVEEWDSFSHVRLVSAVEKEVGFQFTSGEIDAFKSAGDLLDAIILRSSTARGSTG